MLKITVHESRLLIQYLITLKLYPKHNIIENAWLETGTHLQAHTNIDFKINIFKADLHRTVDHYIQQVAESPFQHEEINLYAHLPSARLIDSATHSSRDWKIWRSREAAKRTSQLGKIQFLIGKYRFGEK